jgi:hypothetical protein
MRSAIKVCEDNCPVKRECLAYALANMNADDDDYAIGYYGVWGGTTPADRFRMLGRRAARYAA